MGTVRQLATAIEEGLRTVLPTLRKTVVMKLALAVGAILGTQTPNTVDLANRRGTRAAPGQGPVDPLLTGIELSQSRHWMLWIMQRIASRVFQSELDTWR